MEDEKYQNNPQLYNRLVWIKGMKDLKHALHPKALKPEGDNEVVTQGQKDDIAHREHVHEYLLHKEFEREAKRNLKVQEYDACSFGKTSNYIATSMNVPAVCRGVTYLSKLRMGSLPTVKARIQAQKALNKPCDLVDYTCPICGSFFEHDEWVHFTLTCKGLHSARVRTIQPTINALLEYTEVECPSTKDSLDMKHLYVLLLGGVLRSKFPHSCNTVGDAHNAYYEQAYGSPMLTNWVNGFGHIPDIYPQDFREHGYIPISRFLQEIVPQVEKEIFRTPVEPPPSVEHEEHICVGMEEAPNLGTLCTHSHIKTRARPNGMPESSSGGGG
jgi:hypothetical protein